MVNPLNDGAGLALLGTSWISYINGVPAEVVLGAFTGAVIFVTAADEFPLTKRLILGLASFFAGIIFCRPAASILLAVAAHWAGMPIGSVEVSSALAGSALITAVLSVKLLMRFYKRPSDPRSASPTGSSNDDNI